MRERDEILLVKTRMGPVNFMLFGSLLPLGSWAFIGPGKVTWILGGLYAFYVVLTLPTMMREPIEVETYEDGLKLRQFNGKLAQLEWSEIDSHRSDAAVIFLSAQGRTVTISSNGFSQTGWSALVERLKTELNPSTETES